MPHRYREPSSIFSFLKLRPFAALRETFKAGYGISDLRSDILAGIIVGMVAMPLGMALAIASGVPPQQGLYTVMIGGFVVALLGGSRCQVTGPTAAFVVILAPIAQKFGFSGLLIAGLMAGGILLVMGLARLGRLIEFIPHPVTTGFTAGIAVVIATIQIKDFFGLRLSHVPEHYLDRVLALFQSFGTWSPAEFAVAASTLAVLLLWSRFNKTIPAPLVALTAVSIATILLRRFFPQLDISTIGSRFTSEINGAVVHGVPQAPPTFSLPWDFPGANGQSFELGFTTIKTLLPSAFAIAMLGAIESLLSAVVADGMAQTEHDPDAELVALGVGNILCPFFGGIAATGAIARTATNIRFGARSPIAAAVHAIFTFVVVLLFAPYVSYLPMAALAALLLLVAYNMSEMKHFIHILKVGPRSDVVVLLICFSFTVVFDMVIGVSVGVVLAALLFMRTMSTVTSGQMLMGDQHPHLEEPLPKEILFYEIAGPLFFGAADNAVDAISEVHDDVRIVIFDLEEVPIMDVTGLVAFESAVEKLVTHRRLVILTGIRKQPHSLLKKSGLLDRPKVIKLCHSLHEAVKLAKDALHPAHPLMAE